MIFHLRVETATLDYGKANKNSSSKHSKITHNIWYLYAHKLCCKIQWLQHSRPRVKIFQMKQHYFNGLKYTKKLTWIPKLSSLKVGFLLRN